MKIIEQELNKFEKILSETLSDKYSEISNDINDFVFSKSKKLRPKIIFLYAKMLELEINQEILNLAISTELIHNSTLIHDDIIDEAKMRRGKQSLNIKLGNNLSVLAGDFLLALSMKFLTKCNNIECFNVFANSLSLMCEGEINQHFTLGIVPTMEEYIEKSKKKTAELFKSSLVSLCKITNQNEKTAEEFAINFGIAFQIRDDLINILQTDLTKPSLSDIHNKIYTAPVILLNEKIENLSTEEIVNKLNNNEIKTKTYNLIKEYADKAIASLSSIKDNQYKQELINLSKNLYKVV